MRALQGLAVIAFLFASASTLAVEDTLENRMIHVKRYLVAMPPDKLFRDLATNVSMNFPPAEQAAILEFLTDYVDIGAITEAMEAAMLKHFTADELKALADFYGSDVGQSATSKFGAYMAEARPVINAEIKRAVEEFQKARAAETR